MDTQNSLGGFFSLTPFLLFITLFMLSACVFSISISPLFLCVISVIYALVCVFPHTLSFNKRVELFVLGSAKETVIAMCYIFIFSTVLTHILKIIGGTDAVIAWSMHFVPTWLILPGFFAVVSLFATTIGSSMSAIAAFMPIGAGIAHALHIDPALFAGIVVNGAMLGDNLSILSDTTIAATQTIGVRMVDKFKTNFMLVLPAFIATLFVLYYQSSMYVSNDMVHAFAQVPRTSLIGALPYLMLFVLALCGFEVLTVLVVSIFLAIGIGIWQGVFTLASGSAQFLEGFSQSPGMQEVLILVLLISGLSSIVEYNGGIEYLLRVTSKRVSGLRSAELIIVLLGFFVNAIIAINTITILITGPLVKQLAERFHVTKQRAASLLDIATCMSQGLLPYTPQLLLAGSLAGVSTVSILPFLYYQWFLLLVILGSIIKKYNRSNDIPTIF